MNNMKEKIHTTISPDATEFHIYAETDTWNDLHRLTFSTVWTNAKDPTASQKKFEMFLTHQELKTLGNFINEALK